MFNSPTGAGMQFGMGGIEQMPLVDRLQYQPITNPAQLPTFNMDLGNMNPYAGLMIQHLIVGIQSSVQRGPIFMFRYNYYAPNGFANQPFAELLNIFAGHVEMVILTHNSDPQTTIESQVPGFLSATNGMLMNQFPDLWALVPNEQQAHQMIAEAQRDWNIAYKNAQRANQQRNPINSGLGNAFGNNRPAVNVGGTGGWNAGGLQPANFGFSEPANNDLLPNMNSAIFKVNPPPVASPPAFVQAPAPPPPTPQGKAMIRRDVLSTEQPETALTRTSDGLASKKVESTGIPKNEVKPDLMRMPDGTVLVPAFKAPQLVNGPLKRVYTPEQLPFCYDREKFMLFLLVDDERLVIEHLEQLDPSMDYLKHERNEKIKALYLENESYLGHKPAQAVDILQSKRLVPNKDGNLAIMPQENIRRQLDSVNAPRQLTRAIRAASLEEARFQAHIERNRWDLEDDLMIEYQVEVFSKFHLVANTGPVIAKLRQSQTMRELYEAFLASHKDDPAMSDELFEIVNKRITTAFNRFCQKLLYLGMDIDSFAQDFEEVERRVAERFGEKTNERFAAGVKFVIDQALVILEGDELDSFIVSTGSSEDPTMVQPAIFITRCSVTELPWTSVDLLSRWRMEGVITKDYAPELYDAIWAIFARAALNNAQEHLIMTADSKVIFVYRSIAMDDAFTITMDPPPEEKSFYQKVRDL